jgi:hypothetical protein
MSNKTKLLLAICVAFACALPAIGPIREHSPAKEPQAIMDATDNPTAAENEAARMLLLMKTDQNGNVTREQFLKLAQNQNGVVNVKLLAQSKRRVVEKW